jgi:hypothetical protein
MRKLVESAVVILFVSLLSGCEWGGSGSDSTWSDAYSWINFSGVYRPASGRSFLVDIPGENPVVPVDPGNPGNPGNPDHPDNPYQDYPRANASVELGVSDGIDAHFESTLAHLPIVRGSVTVTAGGWVLTDSDGDGVFTGDQGAGTLNYDTGRITVNWDFAPDRGVRVIVAYSYYLIGRQYKADAPTSGASEGYIYSLTLNQSGNILDAIDNNGVSYHGELIKVAQGGGDSSGNTSGSVVANFTMTSAGGAKIVGVLTGNYLAPRDNGAAAPDQTIGGNNITTGKATDTDVDTAPETVTTGRLLNRQMQGTYIGGDGSTGDLQGVSGDITVTVPQD